jgi:membrane-associated phospholipid phosphatase
MSYKSLFTKEYRRSFVFGLILLALAMTLQFYASNYATRVSSTSVHDIILDNIPVVNLNLIVVEGALAAIAGSIVLLAFKPRYILFALKVSAIFIATRAVFISLTHLGIYPGQVNPDTGFFDRIYTDLGLEAGFFFSGHTGYACLMGLVFWREKLWRYAYFFLSVVFGVSVLFAHVHYSIDVLAAPYITFGVFAMTKYFFPQDYALTENPL